MLPHSVRRSFSSLILPVLLPFLFLFAPRSSTNLPPVAVEDSYTRHGSGAIGPVLQNDSDPDGDPILASVVSFPTHGSLEGLDGNSFSYRLDLPNFTGTYTVTYKACDNHGACSNPATVTINVVNQPPIAVADSYNVNGTTQVGPMLANDSDPDGDHISYSLLTGPSHGGLEVLDQEDMPYYTPDNGYSGMDSFTYRVCDTLFTCSTPAIVTLNVNASPTP